MSPQLSAIVEDLHMAKRRLDALHCALAGSAWRRRPAPGRWSPAECVAHLNLTSQALLPVLHAGLEQAARESCHASRYRRGLVGWLIWKAIAPSCTLPTMTVPALMPSVDTAFDDVAADFERLQAEIISCVRAAEGRALDRVTLVSPFDRRVRYNLYAALTLVPRHQHRHLRQAERAAGVVPQALLLAG